MTHDPTPILAASATGATIELGHLEAVDPRTVWAHEAHDFTPWLLQNAPALADALGLDLELTANEHPVGGYALDLVGRDLTNDCVLIVENQIAGTDHSHLGQLLTYAAGTDAATIVWIATSFREEHRQALDWLNSMAGDQARFFGIEIGAVRIGNSPVAPLFKLRAQPNDWHAQLQAAARTTTTAKGPKAELYRAFWQRFLDRVKKERPTWTRAKVPTTDNWMTMPASIKHAVIGVNFTANQQLRTELYIDSGDATTNQIVFEALDAEREAVEGRFGGGLSWEPMPNRRACRIAAYGTGDVSAIDEHDAYIEWLIATGSLFRAAVDPCAPLVAAALAD